MNKTKVKPIQEYIDEYTLLSRNNKGELLKFIVDDGFDVYNCSTPFEYEGKTYIWGRVEKRQDWATSVTILFELKNEVFVRSNQSESYPIEDPFFVKIGDRYILGGVHVLKAKGAVKTYYTYFYKGSSPFNLKYFTTGPDYMKDIRLVELNNGQIGIFSRPRNDEMKELYGTFAQMGYTVINSLDELDAKVIESARLIPDIMAKDEWGGANQAFALANGKIGIIGHQGYSIFKNDFEYPIYVNTAYVYDPISNKIVMKKVIGVRDDYPYAEPKNAHLIYCAFTSGIVSDTDGKMYLYSGLSDSHEGKKIITDPFAEYR